MDKENHHSSAAPQSGKDDVAVPNLSSPAELAATVAATIAGLGHAIDYINYLEKTNAMLARQVAAEAAASGSSSSSPPPPPPQSVQGMAVAAMSSDVPDACSVAPPLPLQLQPAVPVPAPQLLPSAMSSGVQQPLQQQPLAAAEPAAPPQRTIVARQVGFQTWTWPGLVLSVSIDNAYIKVCSPRHLGMRTMVMVPSVLKKLGIEVVKAQVDSDAVRLVFNIYATVTAMGGENSSALEVYQLAVAEILVWLNTD